MSNLNQENVSSIETDLHENNYFGDDRLRNADFVLGYAARRNLDPAETIEAAKNMVREHDEELAQRSAKQLKLIADTIEATGDAKPRRGMAVVVETGYSDRSVVLIESVRKGKLYGNTIGYEESTYLDGFDLDLIVRPTTAS